MGLGFGASPNTSRQLYVANYISLITPRQLRLASYVIRLALKIPPICLGSCTSPLGLRFFIEPHASPQSQFFKCASPITLRQLHLGNYVSKMASRQLRLDNYVTTITSRHRRRYRRLEVQVPEMFLGSCTSQRTPRLPHLAFSVSAIASRQNHFANYATPITSRSHLYLFLAI